MKKQQNRITVYEHQPVQVGTEDNPEDKHIFKQAHYDILLKHSEAFKDVYDIRHKKVVFKQYVGVLQLGKYTFEILPKMDVDKQTKTIIKPNVWREVLVNMLCYTQTIPMRKSDFGMSSIKNNSILELYFEFFLKELDYLFHRGFIKKYSKTTENVTALKGKLKFSQHISKNLVHHERFYVEHTVYSVEHKIHQLLYKALKVIQHFNTNGNVRALTYKLLLNLPEFKDIKVIPATFEKIVLDRKSAHYKTALNLAKMILLQYYPGVSEGKEEVISLVYDMNHLWEKFVLKSIIKHNTNPNLSIQGQAKKAFIVSQKNNQDFTISNKNLKPDILITDTIQKKHYVLDTKWKNITKSGDISDADFRQMFAYLQYFDCEKTALLYPSNKFTGTIKANFSNEGISDTIKTKNDLIFLAVKDMDANNPKQYIDIKKWSTDIATIIQEWIQND